MNKGSLQQNIETLVRLLPRPVMNGQRIIKLRNSWLILEECDDKNGIVVLNRLTNHEGKIPYDSIREFRKPDMLILLAQVNLGKDGLFEIIPFIDGPETEMMTEEEEILPERLNFAETELSQFPKEYIPVLKQLLISGIMNQGEIEGFCSISGIPMPHKCFWRLTGTSFLEVKEGQKLSIKSVLVPAFEKLLLRPKVDTAITSSQPPQSSRTS